MKKILFIVLSIILSAPIFGADGNHRANLSYGYNGNDQHIASDACHAICRCSISKCSKWAKGNQLLRKHHL